MVSEVTEKKYVALLSRLDKAGIPYRTTPIDDLIKNLMSLKSERDGEPLSKASVRSYLIAIKRERETDREKILEEINRINEEIKEEVSKNRLIGKQKENYLEWERVKEIYEDLLKGYGKSYNKDRNIVLLSCYCLMGVRRLLDYALMCVLPDETGIEKGKNYYIKSGGYFVFQVYKTAKAYGVQRIKLSEEHKELLDGYIEKYKIEGSLFELKGGAIKDRLVRIFKKYTKKTVSVNILRHSYISWLMDNGKLKTIEDRKRYAGIMGHSVSMQGEYYKDKSKEGEEGEDGEEDEMMRMDE